MAEWEITQLSKTIPKLDKPILIEGLPGIGNVGKIAVDFLIEELKAKPLCSFFSHKFPHSVFVTQNNLIEMPKIELYYKKSKNKRDLLLLTGDIQPIDEESVYGFCEEIIKLAQKYNCTEMITTGGIGLQQVPDKPKVYVTGNNKDLHKQYTAKSLKVQKNIFGVVGPIVGVSGILLGLGQKRNFPGVALLAETFAHPMFLGIKGAKEILRVLERKHKLGVDVKKMTKDIIKVEKELMQKTNDLAVELMAHSQAGAKAQKKDVSYIG
ncbi:hypothetical protein HOI26_05655 [Candidatus Woesearchaeota archaeon]|jgi:uncharacterized protein|nr:hypothetical protein [Candidatus Woesearchaeota archaeon]MBT5740553.1 hypothetical protein [Candidatus Woesearchaeota archaeon]